MKLTLKQINDIHNVLSPLVGSNFKSVIGAYKVSKTLKKVKDFVTSYEQGRTELVLKYGESHPETGNVNVTQENLGAFFTEYETLGNLEEELELPFIRLEELDGVEITPNFFIIMGDIIVN